MGAVILWLETDRRHPFIDETAILPSAEMAGVIDPAREDELLEPTTPALQPRKHCRSCRFEDLKLDGPAGLALNNRCPVPDAIASHQVVDAYTDKIAAAQLAVDRQVEQRTISEASLLIEPEADRLNFLLFERPLGADLSADIPGRRRMTIEF